MRLYVGRDIGGVDDLVTTYARTYTVSLNPSYQLTSKVSLNGTVQHQDLRFLGDFGGVRHQGPDGHAERQDEDQEQSSRHHRDRQAALAPEDPLHEFENDVAFANIIVRLNGLGLTTTQPASPRSLPSRAHRK